MEENHTDTIGRRDFLAWAAAAAATLMALPGCSTLQPEVASAPPRPRYRPANNDMAYASASMDGTPGHGTADFIAIPDPPPAIVNGAHLRDETTYGTMNASYTLPPADTTRTIQAGYTVPAEPAYAPPPGRAPLTLSAHRMTPPPASAKVRAISRGTWAVMPPNPAKMKPMGAVRRITIHHEGSAKPNNDTSLIQVATTLRRIHSQHRKRMGAGDIGYHFIIDRTGTIWQGRDWAYQGAHTSGANPNNLGVMLLGNFEIQRPTGPQLAALHSLAGSLVRKYGLNGATDIFGHSDFGNTQCPGKYLRPQVQLLRATAR